MSDNSPKKELAPDVDPARKPLEYKNDLMIARMRFVHGEITHEALIEYANKYRESIRLFKERTHNKKLPIPSISQLLR